MTGVQTCALPISRFPEWRSVGAEGLVVGQVVNVGGQIKVDFRLWDVVVGNQLTGFSYTSQPANWRRLGHIIADAIYKRVTGEEGYFDTRVAYVSETGPANNRTKRIAIMDQDGANNRYITDGSTLALTPRFSPKEITQTIPKGTRKKTKSQKETASSVMSFFG